MTYHLLYFFLKLLSYIPFRVMYVISDVLYVLIYYIFRYRRAIVRKNLMESFPEKSSCEIIDIEKKFYRFFADNLLETCKMTTISREEMGRRMKFTNMETFNAVQREGKSVALYMGHFGNWEWCSSMPLYFEKGTTSAEIYHKLRNESMDRLMMRNRERMGAMCVEMRKTARYINEQAKAGSTCVVGFIADQLPTWNSMHFFVPFLHRDTAVFTGAEQIGRRVGAAYFFADISRPRRGYYECTFRRMEAPQPPRGEYDMTALFMELLERKIREVPQYWLWTHKRWKRTKEEWLRRQAQEKEG